MDDYPSHGFLFFNLRAYGEEIRDGLEKLEKAFQDVFMDFRNQRISISVPSEIEGKQCSAMFFADATAILQMQMQMELPTKLKITIRDSKNGGSSVNPEHLSKGAARLTALVKSVKDARTVIRATRIIKSATSTAATTASRAAATTAAKTAAKTATRAVVGSSILFAAFDGYNIYSTWKNDSQTVKQIEEILAKLE